MNVSIACIVYQDGKILVARRNPTGDMGDRWEFPGGKQEAGETDEIAIIREMNEEFGVTASAGEKIASSEFEHRGKVSVLNAYLVQFDHNGIEKPYVLTEHTEYKWVLPEEIPNLNFVDSDLKIYPTVLEYLKRK